MIRYYLYLITHHNRNLFLINMTLLPKSHFSCCGHFLLEVFYYFKDSEKPDYTLEVHSKLGAVLLLFVCNWVWLRL